MRRSAFARSLAALPARTTDTLADGCPAADAEAS